ncbi:hypothetical protein U7230_05940 [Carboxydochorda subterranea]|uniref:Uncharacterized protein n=1 Tax=Carboxydichorda subterranea TaxID=3109565 RepID=A0ABZ1C0I7_9FIRM|nr:hypothetical protein [Limnochorda sp. L945t]WRP18542.1 hypothetical protein U7230_05940 [Limnochorda sp. L945t]
MGAGSWVPAGRRVGGGAARGTAGAHQAAGGMPVAGAILAGSAVALVGCMAAAVVLGTLQRSGWMLVVPEWLYLAGAYGTAALGGWVSGRLAGHAGLLCGGGVGMLLSALAAWVALSTAASPPVPDTVAVIGWGAAGWRGALAIVVAALAGALGVGTP